MPIRAVIVDFGGVLVRTEDYAGRRKWEARLGLPARGLDALVFDSEAAVRSTMGLARTDEVWKHVAETLRLSDEALAEFRRDFWSGDRLDTELLDWLAGLRPRVRTAILSNAWPDAREAFTHRYPVAQAVDAVIISAEEGLAKPDARIYRLAAERLGVRPDEAVFVDDAWPNVEGARAAGMWAVQFKSREQTIAEVGKYLSGYCEA